MRISFFESPAGGSETMLLTAEHWERLASAGWVKAEETMGLEGYLDCETRPQAIESFESCTGFSQHTITCECCGENFSFFDDGKLIPWWEWK